MRCLNCYYEPLSPEMEECPRCKVHLDSILGDVLPRGTTLRDNTYRLDYPLGRGSFGITYSAHHSPLRERFAIKEFFPKEIAVRDKRNLHVLVPEHAQDNFERGRERFIQEGRILTPLNHPNIVRVYDLFEENNTAYMVMELIGGQTLRQILKTYPGRKLPLPKVEAVVEQLVGALTAIHGAGIYHLDLKPENILLTPDQQVKLIDFGAAREAGKSSAQETRLFTESYAPPEMMTGGNLGPGTDLFTLGMMAYQLITGRLPPSAMERLSDSRSWEPEGLIPPWGDLIHQALQLRQGDRPGSVLEWWRSAMEERGPMMGLVGPGQTLMDLRGTFTHPDLIHDGQGLRLGRGVVRSVKGVGSHWALAIAAGGTALWDMETGEALWEIDTPAQGGTLSPDQRWLIIYCRRWVSVWDLANGKLMDQFAAHPQPITSLSMSGDGVLACGGDKGDLITLWQVDKGEVLPSLQKPLGTFTCVAIHPQGQWVAAGTTEGPIYLWDRRSGQERLCLQGHSLAIECLAFSPDGRLLASGSRDQTIQLWSIPEGEPLHRLKGHLDWVTHLAFSPDGQLLASAAHLNDKAIRLWTVATGHPRGRLKGHRNRINGLDFCPPYLLSSAYDHSLRLWDWPARHERYCIHRHTNWVYALACDPHGKTLAAAYNLPTLQLWSLTAPGQRRSLEGHQGAVTSVQFSGDGRFLLSGSWDRTLRLWDGETLIRSFSPHPDWILAVALDPTLTWVASGGYDALIRLWNVIHGWPRLRPSHPDIRLRGHFEPVTALVFSPDGQFLLSGSKDQTVRLWNVGEGQEVYCFTGHTHHVTCVALSPDGQFGASGSWDHSVRFWHLPSRQEFKPMFTHNSPVTALAYSGGGNVLAVGCRNGDIHLWNLLAGSVIKRLRHHTHGINALVWREAWLYAGDQDGVIRGWDVQPILDPLTLTP